MMNGYPNTAGHCRCQQRCVCPAGQPCRCGGGCTCSQAAAAQASMRTRSWIESGEQEMRPPRARGAWLRNRARNMLQQRVSRQRDWQRRTRLNGLFARRFNWNPYFGRVGNAIGGGFPPPDSQRFMFALARWQQRMGLPVTGILTPSVWNRLLAFLEDEPPAPAAPIASPIAPAAAAAGPDDAAMPLPGDGSEPEPADNEFMPPVGFRARRIYAGQQA